ncbi:sensor histidine kinase [Chitinophaga vietnamensis]|uniref:sensor histidine kinase n=1 Tax=Chitinophaga vietnamensis TaxID=2593957 RepID=UPI0011777CAF|nr:HAMP domain-containing sensor histidine kinase [Chitinophaga vietnamensis]
MMKQQQTFTILLADDGPGQLFSLEPVLEADHRVIIKVATLADVASHLPVHLIIMDASKGIDMAPQLQHIPLLLLHAPLDTRLAQLQVDMFERMYHEQQEKETRIRQQEQFMYMAVHDLKSPLASIVALLGLVNEDEQVQGAPDLKEYMQIVMGATHHLTDMVASILDYTRQTAAPLQKEHVSVAELLQGLSVPAHIRMSIASQLPVLYTYRDRLQQVFQQLVSHAVLHMDKPRGEIMIGGAAQDDYYAFFVRDNGPGLTRIDTDLVFKLFERVEKDGKTSTRLNLFKLLVEEQGGKVWVDTRPGEGSTFHFLWRRY